MELDKFLSVRGENLDNDLKNPNLNVRELKDYKESKQAELGRILALSEARDKNRYLLIPLAFEDLIYSGSLSNETDIMREFAEEFPYAALDVARRKKDSRLLGFVACKLEDRSLEGEAREYAGTVVPKSSIPAGVPIEGYKPPKKLPTNERFYEDRSYNPSQENAIRVLEGN